MLQFLDGQLCDTAHNNRKILQLMATVAARDMAATEVAAKNILGKEQIRNRIAQSYAFHALIWSYYNQAKWQEIQSAMSNYDAPKSIFFEIVSAHSRLQLQEKK